MDERFQFLISQGRYEMAYDLLKDALVHEPDNPQLLSYLATCALYTKRIDEAFSLTEELIRIEPWNGYHFYLRAHIFLHKNDFSNALDFLNEAITIDPYNDVYFELKARILFHQKKYVKAEEAAKMALSIDGQNVEAVNLLARIFNAQGKRNESEVLMDKVLDLDPENVDTHTNYGMQYLEKGKVNKAIEHFQQALFKSPTNEYAQHGMKLAMKAKFPLYKWLLQFQLFMAKQSAQVNFLMIIGIVIVMRSIGKLSEIIGGIAEPIGFTIVGILLLFVLSSWILDSIMTFILYTRKNGRLALNERETRLAKFTGIQLLIITLAALLGLLIHAAYFNWVGVGFLGLLTSQRIAEEKNSRQKWIALGFLSVGSILFTVAVFMGLREGIEVFNQFTLAGVFSCVIYTWVGNSWGRE